MVYLARLILVILICVLWVKLRHLKLPPGPIGLPFLGYLPFLGQEIHLTLTSLSDRYGPIYQIFLGGIRVVVLNDAALVRQAFKQPVFSGRPDTQLTRILQGYGIVNSDGALWKEQRAFLHTALRKLGAKSLMNGSNGLEAKIQSQVREFVNDLSAHAAEGKPCQVRPLVARAVSSVVGSIVMNLTYRKYEKKEKFDRLIELMQEGFRLFSIAMPLDFIPIFRFLPGVSHAYKKMKKNRAETSAFFQDVADEHRKYLNETFNLGTPSSASSLHPRTGGEPFASATAPATNKQQQPQQVSTLGQPDTTALSDVLVLGGQAAVTKSPTIDHIVARDLVDAYILQQKKHETDGKENYFSDQQLVQIMSDIFSAGLETVTATIEWSILFLILNPESQEAVQREIDRVVGRDRLPQLDDLSQMPYTEATIYEVLRRSNVIALGNAHATLDDATIGGYRIPKGTQVLPNLYGIHMNPKLWQEPDKFEPRRFIVNDRVCRPDYFIPFSVGRRMCLGDVLAKMEVFLFLIGLLQKYDVSVADEDRHCPPQVKGTIGVSNTPAAFRVALRRRQPTGTGSGADC